MRVFISSVRRGLEEERDALRGLISAIGHTPVRFEDFTAQTVPSREACLEGVKSSDVYLLLVGPHYGHVFENTGQSATHDEWMAATAAGMPRVVYRKSDAELDADQAAFIAGIEDYGAGVFRDSFSSTAELQTKVAGKIRELAETSWPLSFAPMTEARLPSGAINLRRALSESSFRRPRLKSMHFRRRRFHFRRGLWPNWAMRWSDVCAAVVGLTSAPGWRRVPSRMRFTCCSATMLPRGGTPPPRPGHWACALAKVVRFRRGRRYPVTGSAQFSIQHSCPSRSRACCG